MKNYFSKICLGLFCSFIVLSADALAESTRPTYPTVLGLEGLGRAASASVFIDRMLDENLAVGVGYGGGPISMVPVYGNYYLSSDQGSIYLTGGVTMILNLNSVKGKKTAAGDWTVNESVLPMLGAGYENRSDQGYLFRVTGYAAYADKKFQPWGGISLGFGF